MDNELKGKIIERAHLTDECASLIKMGFVYPSPRELEASLTKKTVDSVWAKGKWIYLKLKPENYLLLGELTSRILYHRSGDPLPKKYHLKLDFADNTFLTVQISFLVS